MNFSSLLKAPVLLLVFSLIGFVDATYLTVSHYTGANLPCRLFDGCDLVTTSSYSIIGPIPVALLGVLFYLSVFILALVYLLHRNLRVPKLLLVLGSLGFLASLYFISLQLWVLKAICLYCMISATLSTAIFLTSLYNKRKAQAV
jgi:uncharacterized membrane protein